MFGQKQCSFKDEIWRFLNSLKGEFDTKDREIKRKRIKLASGNHKFIALTWMLKLHRTNELFVGFVGEKFKIIW